MRYLGTLTCEGVLRVADAEVPASFEIECFLNRGVVTGSGEIVAAPVTLRRMQQEHTADFVTGEGCRMKLMLTDRKHPPVGDVAHVVATGDLPVFENGSLRWPSHAAGDPVA